MENTRIIFIRHGQVHNPSRILYARLPRFRISGNGIREVRETALQLAKFPVTAIYSSPLLRTRQSAKLIAEKLNLQMRISPLLTEVGSIFQGMPLDRYKSEIQPKQYHNRYVKKGHESIADIGKRMLKFVNLVIKKHPGKTVVAVSHGDPIVILKAISEKKHFSWAYKKNNYLGSGKMLILEINKENFKILDQ